MSERKYSVAEIDQMRGLLLDSIRTSAREGADLEARANALLVAHVTNGTDPADLEAPAEAGRKALKESWDRMLQQMKETAEETRRFYDAVRQRRAIEPPRPVGFWAWLTGA